MVAHHPLHGSGRRVSRIRLLQSGAGFNVLPVWRDRLDPKTVVPAPNSDVIYAMGYLDLKKDGPVVFEVPPKLQGILDFWQRCLTDVGLPGPGTEHATGRRSPSDPPPARSRCAARHPVRVGLHPHASEIVLPCIQRQATIRFVMMAMARSA